jgi:hypothetical protein
MHSAQAPSSSLVIKPLHLPENWAPPPSVRALSHEFRLLLACCVWPHSNAREEQISRALQPGLDWHRFLRLTERHRVTGLVHHAFSHLASDAVPEAVKGNLARKAALLARQSLQLANESLRIAHVMQSAEIPAAFLKGVPLAITAYGGLSQRHSRDIDLLVSEEAAPLACRVLTHMGYHGATAAERAMTETQLKRWLRDNKHIGYVHENSGIHVELHDRVLLNPLLNQAFGPDCWEPVAVSGATLVALKRQELILYLCVHGALHAWFRLKWLADIGALLSEATESDIRELLRAADNLDISLPVSHAIQLSSRLLGLPRLERPPALEWRARLLTQIAVQEIFSEPEPVGIGFRHYARLELCPYLFRRDWQYLWVQARCDSTSEADRKLLPLPEALSFLYVFLRPLLWLFRYVVSRFRL